MIIHCPDCNTTTDVPEQRAETAVEKHNNSQHDGNPIAGIGPDAIPLADYQNNTADPFLTHEMGEDAGPAGNHPDGVRAICKDCMLVALFDTEYAASDAVETHNKQKHDGNPTAGICEWDIERLPSAREILDAGGPEALAAFSQAIHND